MYNGLKTTFNTTYINNGITYQQYHYVCQKLNFIPLFVTSEHACNIIGILYKSQTDNHNRIY